MPAAAEQGSLTVAGGLSTLRSIIAAGSPATSDPTRLTYVSKHALDEQISTACMIAVALFYLHSYSWVHENLRTSNVLMLTEETAQKQAQTDFSSASLRRPFLIEFDAARSFQGVYSIEAMEASEAKTKSSRRIYSAILIDKAIQLVTVFDIKCVMINTVWV